MCIVTSAASTKAYKVITTCCAGPQRKSDGKLTSDNDSNTSNLPEPPFETPVNLALKGVVADFDIRVARARVCHFEILLEYHDGGDQAGWEHFRKITGLREPGISIPLKPTILEKQAQNKEELEE